MAASLLLAALGAGPLGIVQDVRGVTYASLGLRRLPNPTDPLSKRECRLGAPAQVCDPDGVLGRVGVARVATLLDDMRQSISMPCGQRQSPVEVAVAIVNSTGTAFGNKEAIRAATSVINSWGVGDPECNNGIALILAVGDRKVALKTGPGARRLLSDDESGHIVEEMRPVLQQGAYADAVLFGLGRIGDKIRVAALRAATRGGMGPPYVPAGALVGGTLLSACAAVVEAGRRASFDVSAQRIDHAYARRDPSDVRLASEVPPAAAERCDVCLRTASQLPPGHLEPALPCGHSVCHACRWRYGPPAPEETVKDEGWRVEGAPCPICNLASQRISETAAGMLRERKGHQPLLPGGGDGAGLRWPVGSTKARPALRARPAAPSALRLRTQDRVTSPMDTAIYAAEAHVEDALWLLRMHSLGSSAWAPVWTRNGRQLLRTRAWPCARTRALLRAEPNALRPPPMRPLGPSGRPWTREQARVGWSAMRLWMDVRRHARETARLIARCWPVPDDGWDAVPPSAAFGMARMGGRGRVAGPEVDDDSDEAPDDDGTWEQDMTTARPRRAVRALPAAEGKEARL